MKISYHMIFDNNYTGTLNKFGGVPTHLPEAWPQLDGCDLAFLFQIYCDNDRLKVPGTLCVQGYQLIEDGNYNSDIMLVQIPLGAKENAEKIGVVAEEFKEGDILFKEIIEQDVYEDNINKNINVFESKLLGWYPKELFPSEFVFLGWLSDEDPFCIGANNKLCMFLDASGNIVSDYW